MIINAYIMLSYKVLSAMMPHLINSHNNPER